MDHKIKRARGWVAKAIAVIAVTVGVSLLGPPWILDSGKAFLASLDNPIAQKQSGPAGFKAEFSVTEINDTRFLELINGEHAVAEENDTESIVSASPTIPVRATDVRLHKTTLEAVSKLFAAAKKAKLKTLYVSSGYRDYDTQDKQYSDAKDKSFVQPAGHSEHHTGLAADILALEVGQGDLADSREGKWLAENAWKYGLILRYPKGKKEITGISYEPWHFRYIGKPHADYCHENNLAFEEYIQQLKKKGGYKVKLQNRTYSVSYQQPHDGRLFVPEHSDYSVSSDNTGGYIVTAWE